VPAGDLVGGHRERDPAAAGALRLRDRVVDREAEHRREPGGHAIAVVGYDDALEIKHASASTPTRGALIIRNSWGTGWGDGGYGYLPYEYVLRRLAVDWWVLIKSEWLDQDAFKQ